MKKNESSSTRRWRGVIAAAAAVLLVVAVGAENNESGEQQQVCNAESTTETCSFSSSAQRLAKLINSGVPVDVRDHMTHDERMEAVGESVLDETTGYRKLVGSFLELLDFTPPETFAEADVNPEERFLVPLLISRWQGGILGYKPQPFPTATELRALNPMVRPSRCSDLAVNYGPDPKTPDGRWNFALMQYADSIPFVEFHDLLTGRPFNLTTLPKDSANIQLQTFGLEGQHLPYMNDLIALRSKGAGPLYRHPELERTHFANCDNPPAIGFAGSLRGLKFHSHTGNWNEAIVGRKLWMMYPPRNVDGMNQMACPWPPWEPEGEEDASKQHIPFILETLFGPGYNATDKDHETLGDRFYGPSKTSGHQMLPVRSCHDGSMTSLQWLIYEMPRLAPEHRPLLFLHHPGELVWIPHNWLHMTLNLDDALYAYKAACEDSNTYSLFDMIKLAKRTCEKTGKFCDEYCYAMLCDECNGWECDCPRR